MRTALLVHGHRLEARIVQYVFVGLKEDSFEGVRDAVTGDRSAVFPVLRIHRLLHTRLCNSVKIIAHLDHDVFTLAAVFTVKVHNRMAGGAGVGEVV